ncbi:hypothetical protein APA_3649 [Pseudanabaena sp. lw0831]|uniref:hypothetical protein n=1 Tax=Pseudanabaena sp. lw0831 TaxID=1357935 RepID=UPI0019150D28|nr:hypothetical protein [Pseudanabaena sp. lw0831]GBO55498.1 hypothetical protein APA_3649 [Pseudanabaena sp. lw0831]
MTAITDTSNSQTLIIAGSYSEYLNWRKKNPSIKSCKYVERIEDIQGIHGFLANIVLYGDYEHNPVYNTLRMRELLAERDSPFRAYVR